jgi:hypothetical protein
MAVYSSGDGPELPWNQRTKALGLHALDFLRKKQNVTMLMFYLSDDFVAMLS